MAAVDFDQKRDRLFAVGDLIDRGPESVKTLELLHQPWFFCCRGNHEATLLRFMRSPSDALKQRWISFGGDWFFQLTSYEQQRLSQLIKHNTALAIDVLYEWGRVGIVHADVPLRSSWRQFIHQLQQAEDAAIETAIWSRERFQAVKPQQDVADVDIILVGHCIVDVPRYRNNLLFIDTGAFLRKEEPQRKLTLLELTPALLNR